MTDKQETLLDFLCRHMVCVAWQDMTPERGPGGKFIATSAFIVEVRGIWMLVTAGHILDDIDKAVALGQKLVNFTIVDAIGHNVRHLHPVPLPLLNTPRLGVQIEGDDYGLILLNGLQTEALRKNDKVAISEVAWSVGMPDRFARYAMVGFPAKVESTEGTVENGPSRIQAAFIPVEPVDGVPSGMMAGDSRFFGRVPTPIRFENGTLLDDIDGMSGGPIFGFTQDATGRWRYWAVAVQGKWVQSRATIGASRIRPFLTALSDTIAAWMESRDIRASNNTPGA